MIKMLQNIYTKELQAIQNKYVFSPEIITRMDEVFNIVAEMGYDETIFNSIQPIQDLQHDVYEFRDYVKFAVWLIAETNISYDHLYYCYLYDELGHNGFIRLINIVLYNEYTNLDMLNKKINIATIDNDSVAFTTETNQRVLVRHILNN
ncbi:hypothetical protein [Haloplasma contractile]|uniref:Uncharacterized protein n=1 Tax=Haloplasma contractile SSD-17B TaxID=1033810 RepID=F7PWV8_9MOLU|nr:hypothetical protein [Haloplasma contractile]ERJ12515.1 hypothetical protein HLPCO_001501 [Haloplasma contractile SSD-17B]